MSDDFYGTDWAEPDDDRYDRWLRADDADQREQDRRDRLWERAALPVCARCGARYWTAEQHQDVCTAEAA